MSLLGRTEYCFQDTNFSTKSVELKTATTPKPVNRKYPTHIQDSKGDEKKINQDGKVTGLSCGYGDRSDGTGLCTYGKQWEVRCLE